MNSDYKRREQKTSRLNGSKLKDSSFENGDNIPTTNSFVRRHQRNLSLPVNSIYPTPTVINCLILFQ